MGFLLVALILLLTTLLLSTFLSLKGDNDCFPDLNGVLLRFILSFDRKKNTFTVSERTAVETGVSDRVGLGS